MHQKLKIYEITPRPQLISILLGHTGGVGFGKVKWECFSKQFMPDYISKSIITSN
jgi:hypothetical protein